MIVLEHCFNEKGKYMGKIIIHETDLTPEFIKKIKQDKDNKMGWRKYHKVLDNKIRNKWRAIKVE